MQMSGGAVYANAGSISMSFVKFCNVLSSSANSSGGVASIGVGDILMSIQDDVVIASNYAKVARPGRVDALIGD